MTNTPWHAASSLYKKLAIGSMIISGTGIVLALIAVNMRIHSLTYVAIGIIVIGLLTHVSGLVVRGRDARAYRIAQGLMPAPKPRKKAAKKS